MTDFFAHLDTPPANLPIKNARITKADLNVANGGDAEKTCSRCHGRGEVTYGYVNFKTYPCNLCRGSGKVTATRVNRVEGAKKARVTAEENLRVRRHDFQEVNKAEIAFIHRNAEFSDFYRSLSEQFMERGSLSDKQMAAIRNGMLKAEAKKAEKVAKAPVVDVTRIEELFGQARSNGLKRLVFRVRDGVVVSEAPAHGANAGALYVKENGAYAGKIKGGRFFATSEASAAVLPRLLAVAADPLTEATLYGKETGECCCCGRELTDPVSVERGIGPICESKWGL
jgi:hypothetical protein